MSKTNLPFGNWASPISAEALTAASINLSEIHTDGTDIYWLESRPQEKGRTTIMRWHDGEREELLPAPINVRSRVNEYGGGSYCVGDGVVYFVAFDDQCIYRLDTTNTNPIPEALTTESAKRFGDLFLDKTNSRIYAVCEDHSKPNSEPLTTLCYLDLKGSKELKTIQQGADFYASPVTSADGTNIMWLEWNHPNLPWDGTRCMLATISAEGSTQDARHIAGGDKEAIVQPMFAPNGDIIFVSDKNNWWNLYRINKNNNYSISPECLIEMPAEFAGPLWVGGLSYYAFSSANELVGCYSQNGTWHLYQLNLQTKNFQTLTTPCCDIEYVASNKDGVYFIGSTTTDFSSVYYYQSGAVSILNQPAGNPFSQADIAQAEAIEFPLSYRQDVGHCFYYPPTNANFCGPDNTAPPLIVICHGGPTSATHSSLNLAIQYWTNRGIAVADVNYSGSTGYGRNYRDALLGQWGIADVQDCIDCVKYLISNDLADADKIAIRGGSAGGYTVLCALTFHSVFKAGASRYGIGDLETLASDTHKFESRYLDNLVGPYPKTKSIYQQRSPINHLDQFAAPVIFLQGLQDKVVPPNQAEAMIAALDAKNIPHASVFFPEEGHGFRQAKNQRRALEAELYFYGQVFGFDVSDNIEPIAIPHLKAK